MFGTNTIKSTLSLSKVLGGISKGLNIVNQAIPIYKEVKPLVGNAKKIISVLGEVNKPTKVNETKVKEIKEETKPYVISSNPTFFQ